MVHFWEIVPSSDTLRPDTKLFRVTWNSLDVEAANLIEIKAPSLSGFWVDKPKLVAIQLCKIIVKFNFLMNVSIKKMSVVTTL